MQDTLTPGKVIVSHPTGNANVTAVVHALEKADLLAAFFTCIAWRPESFAARIAPRSVRAIFERRARVQLPPDLLRTRPSRELIRNLIVRAGYKHRIASPDHPFSIDAVYHDLDKYVARSLNRFRDASAVYAYEDGALHQFRRAKPLGVRCIYDLPIGYWRANRKISEEEAERQPLWSGTLNALSDSDAKCALKDEELALAETIIVPSTFVKSTLEMYPDNLAPIHVTPFGVPSQVSSPRGLTDSSKPLRVLYVGSLTQRKGISYLFEAIEKVGSAVELTVIGRKVGQSAALEAACEKHRWIPSLPHVEVLRTMRNHDVFVFPSLFEGLALVNGEAISQGLPVITTPNSGGADILRDGMDGFIVPIRDSDAIARRLMQLHDDRSLLKQMSDSARERAAELSWADYQRRILAVVGASVTA